MILSRVALCRLAQAKPSFPVESHTIVDPYAYEQTDLVSRLGNWLSNRGAMTDLERSFRDFKRSSIQPRFLEQYNRVVRASKEGDWDALEGNLSPSLFRVGVG